LHFQVAVVVAAPDAVSEGAEVRRPNSIDAIGVEEHAASRSQIGSDALDEHLAGEAATDVQGSAVFMRPCQTFFLRGFLQVYAPEGIVDRMDDGKQLAVELVLIKR